MTYRSLQHAMEVQAELQAEFPTDKKHPGSKTGPELADYIRTMVVALMAELGEVLAEVKWKTWSPDQGEINRDGYVSELIDALQFLLNLFAVADVSAEELLQKLFDKHQINWKRINSGVQLKCPVCKRAIDDEYVSCTADECHANVDRPNVTS